MSVSVFLVLKLCVLIQSGRWCVSLFWEEFSLFTCAYGISCLSLRTFRVDWPLNCLSWERESRCLWITNLQCLSLCLFAPFLWSASFRPISPHVWRLQLSSLYLLCMFLSFSRSSFLCLTQQTGLFYTSYVSTSYNWQFYYLEYRLRGIDSLLFQHISLTFTFSHLISWFLSSVQCITFSVNWVELRVKMGTWKSFHI